MKPRVFEKRQKETMAEVARGSLKKTPEPVLYAAMRKIAETTEGRVLEGHFIDILATVLPADAPDSALREHNVERKMARRFLLAMSEDYDDGHGDASSRAGG